MAGRPSKYSYEVKRKAAIYWFVYRSWGKVAYKLAVPMSTVRSWAQSVWWAEIIEEIRKKYAAKLDSTYTQVLDEVSSLVLSQVKNGVDRVRIDKDGTIHKYQEPMAPKDAIAVLREVTHALALTRGNPTSVTEKRTSSKETLKKIQDTLEAASTPKHLEIDEDPTFIVH